MKSTKRMKALSLGLLVSYLGLAACGGAVPTPTQVVQTTVSDVVEPTITSHVATPTEIVERPSATVAETEPTATNAAPTAAVMPESSVTAQPETGKGDVTVQEIKNQREKLTEAQWPSYEKSIIGKSLSASGYVYDVQNEPLAFSDARTQLDISFDDSTKSLQSRALVAFINSQDADTLSKDQALDVTGTIEKLDCIMTYCTVYLANGQYVLTGDILPTPEYPKLSNFNFDLVKEMRTKLTELQWDHYAESAIGAKMTGSGYVYDVTKSYLTDNSYDLKIGPKKPDEPLATYDVEFEIPEEGAATLNKGQEIEYSGNVKSFDFCIFTSCNVTLENGTYTAK